MTTTVVALRRVANIVNGGTPAPDAENWGGAVPWATPVDLGKAHLASLADTDRTLTERGLASGSSLVQPGAILLSTRAPIGYASRNVVPMAFNQGCKAVVPSGSLDSRFGLYAIAHVAPQLQALGQGSTFLELSTGSLGSVGIPVPESIDEQRHIADYLDAQTAKIDALIGKQEQLIETLAERSQAVISHAVTKGLDPKAPMKDSGTDWLGAVPAAWGVASLRRVLRYLTSGSRGWAEYYTDAGSAFIRIGNLPRGNLSLDMEDTQHVQIPLGAEGARSVTSEGDVLFSITAYLGSVAIVDAPNVGAYVSQHVALARLDQRSILPSFVGYSMLSDAGQTQLGEQAYGGTKVQLSLGDIKELVVATPPMREQHQIVAYLNHETAKIGALSAKAREMIAVLKERRQALISAVVTGKIDVRGLA